MLLWLKAFHIIAMVTWFAALFYLPRLYVYHAMANDKTSKDRFKIMERKLYYGIMTPGGVITTLLGLWMISLNPQAYAHMGWLHVKLVLVALLWAFHIYLGFLRLRFAADQNTHNDRYYRIINEFPTVILFAVVILAVVRPF